MRSRSKNILEQAEIIDKKMPVRPRRKLEMLDFEREIPAYSSRSKVLRYRV
jgi:hypothetical protein